jgi:hypothetical protein
MAWRRIFWIFLPYILESIAVLFLSFAIPVTLLFFSWNIPVTKVLAAIAVANQQEKISDILLIIIPLASLYIATSIAFVYRIRKDVSFSDSYFSLCLFVPTVGLLIAQPVLYYYLISYRDEMLSSEHFSIASGSIYFALTCLVCIEVFRAVCLAESENPLVTRAPTALQQTVARRRRSGPTPQI